MALLLFLFQLTTVFFIPWCVFFSCFPCILASFFFFLQAVITRVTLEQQNKLHAFFRFDSTWCGRSNLPVEF